MRKAATWVVKLGGTMMCAPELAAWLEACTGVHSVRMVLVVGGGARADAVRARQEQAGFDDVQAHRLAIGAMRQNAEAVMAMHPGLELHYARDPRVSGFLWDPSEALDWPEVPCDWSVTSDSLALYLARRLEAEAVVLVKSVERATIERFCAGRQNDDALVDRYLPRLLASTDMPLRIESKHNLDAFCTSLGQATLPGVAYRGAAAGQRNL